MKIAVIGPAYPYRGGIALHTNLLFSELLKNHETKLFNFKRLYPNILFPGKTQYEESSIFDKIESMRIIDSINPLSWVKSAKKILEFNTDLVVIQFWMPFFSFAYTTIIKILRKKNPNISIILLCHNIVAHEASYLDRFLTKVLFNTIDGFIVQSISVKKELFTLQPEAYFKFNPHPIYNIFGTPLLKEQAKKQLNLDGRENIILYFGYVRKYKGLKYLIEAFPKITKKVNARLLIVGEFYDKKKEYFEAIEKSGKADKIQVIDEYVPDSDVNIYFSAADMIILPYISASQSGITQIALAYELPVVVTNVGGLPEVVRDQETGYVVNSEDSDAISKAVIDYFVNQRADGMKKYIKAEQDKYSWNKMADSILNLHEEIMSQV